jgi:hypothetical protein
MCCTARTAKPAFPFSELQSNSIRNAGNYLQNYGEAFGF